MAATVHVHEINHVSTTETSRGAIVATFTNKYFDQAYLYWQNLTQAMDDISGLLQQLGNMAYNRRLQAGELDDNDRADDDRGGEQERLALDDDPRDAYADPGERF